jgi:hydrogenase/urease accessory protein HupE
MRNWFSKSMAGILVGTFIAQLASAHPGHSPTDVAAEVSQPLSGPDHFVVFVALTSTLLVALGLVVKWRSAAKQKLRE